MQLEQFIENFHFLRPAWLFLLLPIIGISALLRRQQDETRGWQAIIAPHLLEALRVRQYRSHWFNPASLSLLLMGLLVLILMGPSWQQQPSPLARDEAALVIALDVSASMEYRDVQPTRLKRAKQKISDLLEQRSGSRTALIAYAGSAHTVLPLTDDVQILNQYLSAIEPDVMPRAGKFAEYVLPLLTQVTGDESLPTTILLLTDGVSNESVQAFSNYFDNSPYQLLVWGIGAETAAEESPYPALEITALKQLASAGSGHYIDLTVDQADVKNVLRRIDSWYVISDDEAVPWQDGGYWLLFPALAIFALWFRKGWTLQWCLPWLLLGLLAQPQQAVASEHWFADLWLTPQQQGRLLLKRGDYRAAAQRFNDPAWKALAYYYAEEFTLAAEYYSRIDSETARFNRANALAQSQNYLPAVRLYQEILDDNPSNAAALRNRDIVQQIIDAINLMSQSQQEEAGEGSKELGESDPERAEGAERISFEKAELVSYSAEEILQDPKIAEMWMRGVQRDPAQFLAIKFSMQEQPPAPAQLPAATEATP
ncbi:VWA domain-containing protein [Halieaceae bacterium IMCC14734]|uniref:VWA domain-containing protein n=1 Tax=Candidatus Litorirhabdus singularis TaxID=2518993 RepID=A0ABT3TBT4_9GAMM|nr:VWA domain-containing protein [Candidatus Litorirhabdus singularis]MCX2979720.1 VWA domain-containing protein [Candidatus Litorirhabdus singularis]